MGGRRSLLASQSCDEFHSLLWICPAQQRGFFLPASLDLKIDRRTKVRGFALDHTAAHERPAT